VKSKLNDFYTYSHVMLQKMKVETDIKWDAVCDEVEIFTMKKYKNQPLAFREVRLRFKDFRLD
jgi:hypothetical protein